MEASASAPQSPRFKSSPTQTSNPFEVKNSRNPFCPVNRKSPKLDKTQIFAEITKPLKSRTLFNQKNSLKEVEATASNSILEILKKVSNPQKEEKHHLRSQRESQDLAANKEPVKPADQANPKAIVAPKLDIRAVRLIGFPVQNTTNSFSLTARERKIKPKPILKQSAFSLPLILTHRPRSSILLPKIENRKFKRVRFDI